LPCEGRIRKKKNQTQKKTEEKTDLKVQQGKKIQVMIFSSAVFDEFYVAKSRWKFTRR